MAELGQILKNMTIKQKLAQLTQLDASFHLKADASALTGPLRDMGITPEDVAASGTALGAVDARTVIEIQKKHLENDPNHIPLLFMLDIIHGFRTIFPIPLALGCTWDPSGVGEAMSLTAREAYASGIHVNFSPMCDLVRDARWGRVMESTGEDPYLNALFAQAFVKGYQGESLRLPGTLAACVKHFAGYGAVEAGRDYNTVDIGERMLREYYLTAYAAALSSGCKMVMSSFNVINGIPAAANEWLLQDVLRKEWGFDGVLISDWGAVEELIAHGVAENGREAALRALKAGVDIEMMSVNFLKYGEQLVQEGLLEEEQIDRAVMRILRLKDELGLFENPYRGADTQAEAAVQGCGLHRKKALEMAQESIVLLKNDGVLPLSKEQSVAVIGPYAQAAHLLGGWSCNGRENEAVTLREGILADCRKDRACFVQTLGGFANESGSSKSDLINALRAGENAEVIVLALGEHPDMSGEASSRAFIGLPAVQEKLAKEIFSLGKPTVVVLFSGRPLDTGPVESANAIVEAWFPGTEGGRAVADILYGEAEPQGRLTMSFPRTVGQLPMSYNHLNTGRPIDREWSESRYLSRYLDVENAPRYPFGFGLSYTEFEYGEVSLSVGQMAPGQTIVASVPVRNIGRRRGVETVQLYIRDTAASVARPVRELKGYKKIELAPGETEIISFIITEEMLRFHTKDGTYRSEPGRFIVSIDGSSLNTHKVTFFLEKK